MEDITQDMQYYAYYLKAYGAVLCNFLGDYSVEVYDEAAPDQKRVEERYGLKCFSPIAAGYGFRTMRISATRAATGTAASIWATT